MVVDDDEQRCKIVKVWDQLPELKSVIQYTGEVTGPGVISWKELVDMGRILDDSVLTQRLERQAVNQAGVLIYTSGTTGNPKGVMLSQDNITWTVRRVLDMYESGWDYDTEHVVSYLPLSHVAGTFIDIYQTMMGGCTVHFADKMALQGTLLKTLVEAKPTLFFGVPRVYEKIQEKMSEVGKANSGLKKKVAEWAKASSFEHHEAQMAGLPGNSLSYRVAKKVVLSQVHKALGFERTKGFYCSAAPLSEDVFRYFQSLDMPIQELLGSSETSGPQTASMPGAGTKLGSVGRCYDAWTIEIQNPDPDSGLGEIVTSGRNCSMGYLWDEKKTAELVDAKGGVHSGDLGKFDSDGFLFIGGRQKEIIVTGGGENVAPVPIEDMIKVQMKDIVSNCMVLGDKRKHLACIITLRTVLDSANLPTDQLHPDVVAWAEELGAEAETVTDLLAEDNKEVQMEIMAQIQKVNRKAVSAAQKVHKFMIAPKDFSLPGGELTPTLKLKRHFVIDMHEKKINQIYEHETQSSMW
jgi:long-chain-fatty-acid--CoA ligase ACSBG